VIIKDGDYPKVDRLIEQIKRKMESTRPSIQESLEHGRVSWRLKNGEFDITVHLEI